MRATSKSYPWIPEPTPQPQVKHWKWNRAKAYDNLLTVVGMAAVAAFLTYMLVGWVMGTWQ